MQLGAKPLLSDVSVKFGGGNRYGPDGGERLRQVHVHEDSGRGVGAERGVGGDRIQLKEPGQNPTRAIVAAVQLSSVCDRGSRTFAGSCTAALDKYPGTL